MVQYFVGVDLGQSADFTAVAVVERAELKGEWDPVTFAWRKTAALRLRHLERTPLGTPYPDVVDRVAGLTLSPGLTLITEDTFATACWFLDIPRPAGTEGKAVTEIVKPAGQPERRGPGTRG